jgi:hypothetical protein
VLVIHYEEHLAQPMPLRLYKINTKDQKIKIHLKEPVLQKDTLLAVGKVVCQWAVAANKAVMASRLWAVWVWQDLGSYLIQWVAWE